MTPTIRMVTQEKINVWNPNKLKLVVTIKPSMMKITKPTFNREDSDINCANKSVPAVLIL